MENIFIISAKLRKTKSFQFCLFTVNFAFGIIYDIKKYNLDKDMFQRHLSKFYWSKPTFSILSGESITEESNK